MASSTVSNCPNVLAHGTCDDNFCVFNHTIVACEVCALVFKNDDDYQTHLTNNKHLNRVSGRSVVSFCSVCNTNVSGGQQQWKGHVKGRKHRNKETLLKVSEVQPQIAVSTGKETFCELCQIMVPNMFQNSHAQSQKHLSREAFTRYRSAVAEAEADKHDITVEGNSDFDFVPPNVAQGGIRAEISVRTTQPSTKCTLLEFKLASSQGARVMTPGFNVVHQSGSTTLSTSRPLILLVVFKQPYVGRYEDRLELVFQDTQLKKRFIITRTLSVIVGDKTLHEQLKPKTPYRPRTRTALKEIGEIVEGVKPKALKAIPYVAVLPKATVPTPLQDLLRTSESIGRVTKQIRKIFLPEVLTSKTYGRFFKHLLWIEELKMERDLEKYDISDAVLTRHNNYYYIPVPGLAEKRPSVLVGDRILVQEQNASDTRWFEGHVHVVRQAEVGLCFHSSFGRYNEGRRFHVRFKLSRIPLRRQHQAMDTVFMEDRVLFPLLSHLPVGGVQTKRDVSLSLYNSLISKNEPQVQAVVSIVTLPPGSSPFIVFGPPGTGKTVTMVEAIRQVLVHNPQAKILACAPSNSAADLIASRLKVGLSPKELFRFYAPSRYKNQVPDELLSYTFTDRDGHFSVPPPARIRMTGFRVIVTTCISASIAHGIGLPRGVFSHIFMDEAGQATEPEAFVSIKTMADTRTNIILSGDPKQLGPVIRSGIAIELGLEKSYLERLMDRDAYNLKTGYGKSIVKLIKNFRSHNAILRFPNERFYNNDLQQFADPSLINFYLNSQYLPSKKFPIVFHSISGKDDREATSPSFFNIDEVALVRSYVQRLKEDRRFRTADRDIGIIAPYHAQCLKLRNSLRNIADSVKVGSVEEFQGQERKVIIISTVRSSKAFVEYDLRHTLGFVANPRRFNVAVTRAQALLIVVGDPQVLCLDPLWRSFLNYIYQNGGWTGPDIPWDPKLPVNEAGGYDKAIKEAASLDMNEFARRMEGLTMAEIQDEIDGNVDRPWRDLE